MEMVAEQLQLKAATKKEVRRGITHKVWEYEANKCLYYACIPLMGFLVLWVFAKKFVWHSLLKKDKKEITKRTNSLLFDGLSQPLREIKEGAASWKALHVIYNHETFEKQLHGISWLVGHFWLGMRNAQAVRNRKRLVVEELSEMILEVYEKNNRTRKPRIFSIASGSAQAVFEAIRKVRIPVELKLLDLDPEALRYSCLLLSEMGLDGLVTLSTIKSSATNCGEKIKAFHPDIVEMVGFMDYRPNKKAIELIQEIHNSIPAGSYFLTANICPNAESAFLAVVINWSMIYREETELERIIIEGGFSDPLIRVEPQNIHALAVAQK